MILTLAVLFVPAAIRVQVDPDRVLNSFVPAAAIGADLDGHEAGDTGRIFQPHNLDAMRSSGVRSLSYRLRTELAVESWHWNPVGRWSDPAHRQGYWTSSAVAGPRIQVSYGYRLPRRGNTLDQANNDGYSRIDDGDPASYWKSNPYLDPAFTGHPASASRQWVVVDLGRRAPVDTLRVIWANPYAARYRVEYWAGDDDPDAEPLTGAWRVFPSGTVGRAAGGEDVRRLGDPRAVRFVRLWLLASSHTSEPDSDRDPRDRMGFAIREIGLGRMEAGRFVDAIIHRPDRHQTVIYTSSTDPWHRVVDRDPRVEQPGFDCVYSSGLTRGRPMLVPVPVLYDTPDNARAELRWLIARGYPIRGLELGEEPDGQYVDAAQYATLYARLAARLARLDPHVQLGGPCLQTLGANDYAWPERHRLDWFARFVSQLRRERALRFLKFASFEWYPCGDRQKTDEQLLQAAAGRLDQAVATLSRSGLPKRIPWMITEFGYSSFARPAEDDLAGALLNLDVIGKTLSLGGTAAFEYGYEPAKVITERPGEWGNMMMWLADDQCAARYPLPVYWATRLLTQTWCADEPGLHQMLAVGIQPAGPGPASLVAYAVRRPDRSVAVMLLNESAGRSIPVRLRVGARPITNGRLVRWGAEQYSWRPTCATGCPARSFPPVEAPFNGPLELAPFSATVVIIPPPT